VIQRTLSTLGLWAVVVAALFYFGPAAGVWLLALMAAAAQWELYGMMQKMGHRPFRKLGCALGFLVVVGPYYAALLPEPRAGLESALVAVALVACCLRILGERSGTGRFDTLVYTLFGLVYIPFMLHFLVRIFLLSDPTAGLMLALWLIVAAKFCDVGALLSGMAFGRHKMSPELSPKKTWEGAIGGVLIAMGMASLLTWSFQAYFPPQFTPLLAALLAAPIAGIAIVSDLVESLIKRHAHVKDSGRSIPGIGGAFDLLDSLVLAAPVGYLLLRLTLRS
jgi:phosphatidate cytidylyltransferase